LWQVEEPMKKMTIEIGCYCGQELKTTLEARHDFMLDGEDEDTEMVECKSCGMKARISVHVSVENYGKD
jgi:hypothetical protein